MSKIVKAVIGSVFFFIWGTFMIYVWLQPAGIPAWAQASGFRRALFLSRYFEPTIITLLCGIAFTGVAIYGVIMVLSGKARSL